MKKRVSMGKDKPYIIKVLEALHHFSQKQEAVTKVEIGRWITPKITPQKLNAAICNFNHPQKGLIHRTGVGTYRLNSDVIEKLYTDYLDGKALLWVAKEKIKKDKKPKKKIEKITDIDSLNKTSDTSIEYHEPIETDELTAVDAANVGAAIIAYVRKLKSSQDKSDIEKVRAINDDLAQQIINLKNHIMSLEGKLSKIHGMYEAQNKNIIDLNHKLETEKKQNKELKALKSPNATFKSSDVARITKLIKG